jgi:Chlorophyll A-B binding protein
MKVSLTILAATMGAVCAFAPSAVVSPARGLKMSDEATESVEEPVVAAVPAGPAIQGTVTAVSLIKGWAPDASKPCYGLPGAVAPLGYFDPLGFCKDRELDGVKRFREAEIMHGRVAVSKAGEH